MISYVEKFCSLHEKVKPYFLRKIRKVLYRCVTFAIFAQRVIIMSGNKSTIAQGYKKALFIIPKVLIFFLLLHKKIC